MVFMATAEHGSFSAAARILGVSPAAISQSIARLEQELEVRLFNRTTRQLIMTVDGRRFFAQCKGPINHLDLAIKQLKESHDEPTGHLRISLPNSFGRRYILPLMSEFNELYPRIKVFFGLNDHFNDLAGEEYDIEIKIGLLPDSRMAARSLAPNPLYVVATPAYWQRHAKPQTPQELEGHSCINYQYPTSGRIFQWEFELNGERMPMEVLGSYTANEIEAVSKLARLDLGVAQLPGYEAMPYIRNGELETALVNYISFQRTITICYPNAENMSPRTRVFVDFIAEKLSDNPDITSKHSGKHNVLICSI